MAAAERALFQYTGPEEAHVAEHFENSIQPDSCDRRNGGCGGGRSAAVAARPEDAEEVRDRQDQESGSVIAGREAEYVEREEDNDNHAGVFAAFT